MFMRINKNIVFLSIILISLSKGEGTNNNLFKMKVYEPIKPSSFKDTSQVSEKLNKIIENMIIKNPNQWIWTHDRWK